MTAADAGEAVSARTRSASPSDRMPRKPATSYEVVRNARPLLCGPPALDALRRHRNRSADRARRGEGASGMWCCSPTTTRSLRSETARRAGTAACSCSPARRCRRSGATTTSPSASTTEIRHRGLDACGDREGGAGGRRLRLRGPSVLRGSERFKRPGMPFGGLDCEALHGIELWNWRTTRASGSRASPPRCASSRCRRGCSTTRPSATCAAGTSCAGPGRSWRSEGSTHTSTGSESGRSCPCG